MERKEDKNKENTLVNQAKSCKMQIAQSVLDKESVQHLSSLTNAQANILFVSLSLIYQEKWYLFTRFSVLLKSTFMISMMNDEDLTDSTQKRLQWDAEDRG